ncbi:MAG: 4-hydroxythreonine-4-phosphate dehydrogenase 2, partial [Pseudomonadota bacterium]
MTMNPNLPLAITMGDPNGIGPELCVKLFADGVDHPAFVVGDIGTLQCEIATLGLSLTLRPISNPQDCALKRGVMDVMAVGALPDTLKAGMIDARAGQAAY